eukprot:5040228-Prymnesium_polylepis.1
MATGSDVHRGRTPPRPSIWPASGPAAATRHTPASGARTRLRNLLILPDTQKARCPIRTGRQAGTYPLVGG